MNILKQSTSVTVKLGPFVDAGDGVTLETGLATAMDNATTGIRVSKNGGNYADRNDATVPVYDEMGDYDIVLSATDTNTCGTLRIIFEEAATCLPVWRDFQVVEEAIYDALFAGSAGGFDANGRVDVAAVAGTAQTARDLGASVLLSSGTGTGQISLSSGEVTPTTASKTGYRLSAAGVDDIFDEAVSGHTTEGSFGQQFQSAQVGTATAGGATTIDLDATNRSATTDFYKGSILQITSGTGAGQARFITGYNGGTGQATVGTWATNPDATSNYVITPFDEIVGATAPTASAVADAVWDESRADHTAEGSFGALLFAPHEGTAQAGTASTLTLDATGSSATDDFYKYGFLKIVAGTGAGQPARQITGYNGTTKVATVSLDWTTTPSTDSQYVLTADFGIDAATVTQISAGVWDTLRTSHDTAGTFGEYVRADSLRVSGSTTAADLLEAATTGATPLPSNTTQWLGSAVAAVTQAGVPGVDVTFVGGVAEDLPTATALATVDANVDAILVDTGTDIPATLGTPVTSVSADIAAVKTVADAIEVDTQNIQSRLPAALSNGAIQADIQRINDVALIGDGSITPFTV